eukprot:5087429-Amphidinium_carterae.1
MAPAQAHGSWLAASRADLRQPHAEQQHTARMHSTHLMLRRRWKPRRSTQAFVKLYGMLLPIGRQPAAED